MFEVEKKFTLSNEQIKQLTQGAEFEGEKTFSDTYYDDSNYSLTTQDMWLRLRDGKFELKVPLNTEGASKREADRYQELTTDQEIKGQLRLPKDKHLAQALEQAGYNSFCIIETTRRIFRKGPFRMDFDVMDFGYTITEIELLVDDESQIPEAQEKIMALANKYKLPTAPVIGKVIEYIRRNNPTHYQALVEAGVV